MAGWDIRSEPGTPFYNLVAPIVPKADTTAAEIISRGTSTALEGLLGMAKIRQQQDYENKRMLYEAGVESDRMKMEQERLDNSYQLGKDQNNYMRDHYDTLDRATKWKMGRDNKEFTTTFDRNLAYAQQTADMLDEAGKTADEFQLFDPKFQTEHPVKYAANALSYEQMYGATTEPRLKATIKSFINKSNASTVRLGKDEYPWAQVAEDIQKDPNSPFVEALDKAGYFTRKDSTQTIDGQQVPTTVREPKGVLKNVLEDLKTTDFIKARETQSKLSPFAPRNATQAIAAGTLGSNSALPASDLSSLDDEINHVKSLSSQYPEKAAALKAQFFQNHPDADPNSLTGPVTIAP